MNTSQPPIHEFHWVIPADRQVDYPGGPFEAGTAVVTWNLDGSERVSVTVHPRRRAGKAVSMRWNAVDGYWPQGYPAWVWKIANLSYYKATGQVMPRPPAGFAVTEYKRIDRAQ